MSSGMAHDEASETTPAGIFMIVGTTLRKRWEDARGTEDEEAALNQLTEFLDANNLDGGGLDPRAASGSVEVTVVALTSDLPDFLRF